MGLPQTEPLGLSHEQDDADWQEGAYAAAMAVFARDGWDDPRMDEYDALDPRTKP